MELTNATRMQAGYTLGLAPDGRESIVVAIKGTFDFPASEEDEATLAEDQVELVLADEFTGEPGFSAVLCECDYAPVKPRCDVLLNGSAHAEPGAMAERVTVQLTVGSMSKSFDVIGDRVFAHDGVTISPSRPRPFESMTISYDRAYGGCDTMADDPEQSKAYMDNPVGVGFYALTRTADLEGMPLPNTEESSQAVTSPHGTYRPMSFGALGRQFSGRVGYAGTYDDAWMQNTFPFLPSDFDSRYFQSAPPDQQIDYPAGGERVELINLTPEGRVVFRLPALELPVEFTNDKYERFEQQAVLDTIVIEPDQSRLMLTWRASIELRKNIFEIPACVVGRMTRGWYRARALGKTWYPNLKALTDARRGDSDI